ncbi:hypothetical protein Asal01_02849 [Fodinibius salicampi]
MRNPMTSLESAQFIANLESAGFDYQIWDHYKDLQIPTSTYDHLLKDCDPRPINKQYQKSANW